MQSLEQRLLLLQQQNRTLQRTLQEQNQTFQDMQGFSYKTQSNDSQMEPSRTLHHLAGTQNRVARLGTTGFKGLVVDMQVRFTAT